MYKVTLHTPTGEKTEFSTSLLHYAKRYADLYKDDYPFVEIIECSDRAETVIETFGSKIN